jgi:Ala-tRNA(Pro) deacylase
MITEDLAGELSKEQIDYELVAHRHTEHARDEAAALGVAQEEVGKTLILTSDGGYMRVVIPASERLDLGKVREHVGGGGEIRLASERELVGAYPEFALGAVPPFGGPSGDRILVDRRTAVLGWVIVEAGTHEQSLRIRTADLLALTKAEVADFCLG